MALLAQDNQLRVLRLRIAANYEWCKYSITCTFTSTRDQIRLVKYK